jgi:hypothetical protein
MLPLELARAGSVGPPMERSKDREEASPNCLLMVHFTSHELSL